MAAPSFWACLTLEFINTVHLEPRSTGDLDVIAFDANSPILRSKDSAKVSKKDPHPAEHASFNSMLSITPFLIFRHFISCPPISRIKSTPGQKKSAAL